MKKGEQQTCSDCGQGLPDGMRFIHDTDDDCIDALKQALAAQVAQVGTLREVVRECVKALSDLLPLRDGFEGNHLWQTEFLAAEHALDRAEALDGRCGT